MDEQISSKEERRQARREERQQQSQRDSRRRLTRRIMMWSAVAVVLIGIGWLMFRAAGTVSPVTTDGTLSVPVSSSDIIMGPASASVTLVEYSDFQCPACAAFNPVIKQMFTDPQVAAHVRLVYRYFPLRSIHQNAQASAQAAQAALLQGKFWEMHDKLFDQQTAWENLSPAAVRTVFISYASSLGLDITKFAADFDSQAVKDVIQADYESAVSSGVDATPTFFVNGRKMAQPTSFDDFKAKVLAPLNAN